MASTARQLALIVKEKSARDRSLTETADQIFERTRAREIQLSRLLIFYISGGLLFVLLPGTFLGVWNLISIPTVMLLGAEPLRLH
jgi:hypothetical protein